MRLSAVINTRNEERTIGRCLQSVNPHVDEIIVVDMHSTDATAKKARKFTKKIYRTEPLGYVEPARNYAINKANGDWVLLVDADEVVPESLGLQLRKLAENQDTTYYRIPRKNMIFGRWITHSGWWPDYQIRFFKKGKVTWNNEIHSIPMTVGKGQDLADSEANALTHYHYNSISEYLERLNRYTSEEVKELSEQGYEFEWKNVLLKPMNEFLSRYFLREGYKDGLHGLALALLQATSYLVVQLKLWEQLRFPAQELTVEEVARVGQQMNKELHYWRFTALSSMQQGIDRYASKLRAKVGL